METPTELVPRSREARSRFRKKKGCIIAAYLQSPPQTRVICVDEMGPLTVKTYPGEEWHLGKHRATFEPATGQATILTSSGRDSASHIQLLEKMMSEFSAQRWLIIEDNLVIHSSREVRLALASRPEIQIQFLPKYACWLNLIEPWWKQLRSLALKGRCFEDREQLIQALDEALAYWNDHCHPYLWKKRLQEQLPVLGGFGVHLRSYTLAI